MQIARTRRRVTQPVSDRSVWFVEDVSDFDEHDARSTLTSVRQCARPGDVGLLLALPLALDRWHQETAEGWRQLASRSFWRRGLLGKNEFRWELGYFDSDEQFARTLAWLWRASAGEALHLLCAAPEAASRILDVFEDDWGDSDHNDAALLSLATVLASRAYEGSAVRFSSDAATAQDLALLLVSCWQPPGD